MYQDNEDESNAAWVQVCVYPLIESIETMKQTRMDASPCKPFLRESKACIFSIVFEQRVLALIPWHSLLHGIVGTNESAYVCLYIFPNRKQSFFPSRCAIVAVDMLYSSLDIPAAIEKTATNYKTIRQMCTELAAMLPRSTASAVHAEE